METRTIEQVKIFKLLLNPMTANYERTNIVAIAFSEQDLKDWYEDLKVEPYQDGRWSKIFKKDSKLEYYNPIEYSDYCGIEYEWTTEESVRHYMDDAQSSFGFTEVPEMVGGICV